jgi:hypothetical protein
MLATALIGLAVVGAACADPGFPLFSDVQGSKYSVTYDNRSLLCVMSVRGECGGGGGSIVLLPCFRVVGRMPVLLAQRAYLCKACQ